MGKEGRVPTLVCAWCALIVIVAAASMVSWMVRHPLPEGWDETRHVLRMHRDARYLHEEGPVAGAKALLVQYRSRPPAFRLAALPLSYLVAPAPLPLRLWSMGQLLAACAFLYMAAKVVAGRQAGCVAVALLLLSPTIRAVGARVYTEPPLYLAIAASLYFLIGMLYERGTNRANVIGLALSLALGLLAKLSFAVVICPVVGLALLAAALRWAPELRLKPLGTACGLAAALVAPVYLLNLSRYVDNAMASNSGRWALLASGASGKLSAWLGVVSNSLLGPASTALLVFVLAIAIWDSAKAPAAASPKRATAVVLACVTGALPLLLLHLVGQNQHPRLASPALVPIVLMLGVLTARHCSGFRWRGVVAATLLLVQTILLSMGAVTSAKQWPVQWNWDQLRAVVQQRVPGTPSLAYMGLRTEFNNPQLEYPWAIRDEPVWVTWLYDYTQGDIDWQAIDSRMEDANVIITLPEYTTGGAGDNGYNAEFAERLMADERFDGPVLLEFGAVGATTVAYVFFRVPAL